MYPPFQYLNHYKSNHAYDISQINLLLLLNRTYLLLCLVLITPILSFSAKAFQKLGFRGSHSASTVFQYEAMKIKILPALSDNYMYLVRGHS